jgi:hypothetical protein
MYILELRLERFWAAKDIDLFNTDIHGVATSLPAWKGGNDVEGAFCQSVVSLPAMQDRSEDPGIWQELVTTLKKHKDFESEPFFYYVSDVRDCVKRKSVGLVDGTCWIRAGKTYEIRLIQYIPSGSLEAIKLGESCWLMARNEDEQLSFVSSKTLAIDSPYDEQFVRFQSPQPSIRIDSAVTFLRQTAPGLPDPAKAIWDFDLPFRIDPDYPALIAKGVLMGMLIAMQGVVPIYLNPDIADKLVGYVLLTILGLVTGQIASFGLRKL